MSIRFAVAAILLVASGRVLSLYAQQGAAPGTKTVATVNGAAISEEELKRAAAGDLENLELEKLQAEANFERTRHQLFEKTLKKLIEDKMLAAESAKQSISTQELLAKEVDQKLTEPTDEEVKAFYEANKARIPRAQEQVAPQIRQYLKQQSYAKVRGEYFERLSKQYAVVNSLGPLRFPVDATGPSRGPADSPVTLVEFSDFQCSYCKSYSTVLRQVLKDYSSDVRLVYRQFPLSAIHPQAQKAAEASLCAANQGHFWEMHDLMFEDQGALKIEDLKAKATKLGLNGADFNECLDSGRYAESVKRDLHDGATLGIQGTPALFINGRFLDGSRPYNEVADVVKEELQKKKKP